MQLAKVWQAETPVADQLVGIIVIAEYNSSNVLQRRFVFGPGVDEPLVQYEGTGTTDRRWLHSDERGSVIATSNGSGALTQINKYDEFGVAQSGNSGRFQYTGQAWLPELSAYYYKARVYAPHLGRFLQPDPIGYADSPNLYAYVLNDPVNFTDPLGLVGTCTGRPEGDIFTCPLVQNIGGSLATATAAEIVVIGIRPPKPVPPMNPYAIALVNLSRVSALSQGGPGPRERAEVTPEDIEKAKKEVIKECAEDQQSAACAAAKEAYSALWELYNQQHPLPGATGRITGPDYWDSIKSSLDLSACIIGVAGAAVSEGLVLVITGGAALYGCSQIIK